MTKTHLWGHCVWISDGLAYTRHNIHSFVKATQLKRNSTEWMRDVKVSGLGCSGAAIPERLPPPPSSEYNLYSASSASHLLAPPLRPGGRVGLQTVSLKSSTLPAAIGWEGRREQDVFSRKPSAGRDLQRSWLSSLLQGGSRASQVRKLTSLGFLEDFHQGPRTSLMTLAETISYSEGRCVLLFIHVLRPE